MENTPKIMHMYKCATCLKSFDSDLFEEKCPYCRGKVLIHLDGERKKSSCSGCSGNCSCCSSSCGH